MIIRILLILLLASTANAAVYLDGTTTGCTDGSTNYAPATRSCGAGSDTVYTSLASFNTNLVAQTTNYIRAGSYYRTTTGKGIGALQVLAAKAGNASNYTIIKAYTGEERQAIIGTASDKMQINPAHDTSANGLLYYPNAAVTVHCNYVVIDGIKTYGQVLLKDTTGGTTLSDITVKNCDIGGGGPYYDWGHALYMENTRNVLIQNNLIHDNTDSTEANTHKSLFNIYASRDFVVEKNTFYNGYGGPSGSMTSQGDARYTDGGTGEWRFNFYYVGTGNATKGWQGLGQYPAIESLLVHNNIFLGVRVSWSWNGSTVTQIYNNTFVGVTLPIDEQVSQAGAPSPSVIGMSIYNNVFYNSSDHTIFWGYENYLANISSNYNVFYNSNSAANTFRANATTYANLTAWQAVSKDADSITSNPNFVNASGANTADYKRTSYAENFTGSSYGIHAGAYETGSEAIGADFSGGGDPPADPPATSGSASRMSGGFILR